MCHDALSGLALHCCGEPPMPQVSLTYSSSCINLAMNE